jgi:hemoglobin-like flavoprotein
MGISRHPLCTTSTTELLPDVPADAALIRRLEDSFHAISARGDDIAERFYKRLFEMRPDLRALFPADMAAQRRKLFDSLSVVIENLRRPQQVRAQLEALGKSHVRYGAKAEHYPLVAELLVGAMADGWTAELKDDWSSAMRLVCEIMLEGARASEPQPESGPHVSADRAERAPPQ